MQTHVPIRRSDKPPKQSGPSARPAVQEEKASADILQKPELSSGMVSLAPSAGLPFSMMPLSGPGIQKKEDEKETEGKGKLRMKEEEEKIKDIPIGGKGTVRKMPSLQFTLEVGKHDDKFEREANHTADRVMKMDQGTGTKLSAGSGIQASFIPLQGQNHLPALRLMPEEKKEGGDKKIQMMPRLQTMKGTGTGEEEGTGKEKVQKQPAIQLSADGNTYASPEVSSAIHSTKGGGNPLPPPLAADMGGKIGADFSNVKIHTDSNAIQLSQQLGAQAFTHGSDIYFNEGKYSPDTHSGKHLLAHELTHVVQQQGDALRQKQEEGSEKEKISAASEAPLRKKAIQRFSLSGAWSAVTGAISGAIDWAERGLEAGKEWLLDKVSTFVANIPGYKALTVVLKKDPITGRDVERNGRNFIEAALNIIPFGDKIKAKLDEKGILDKAAAWLDGEINAFSGNISNVRERFLNFWRGLSLSDLASPEQKLREVADILKDAVDAVISFAVRVGTGLVRIIKDFVIHELAVWVKSQTRAYPLLTVILGQDPITKEEVSRSPMNIFTGFMELSEWGHEQLRQLQETGALQRAVDWLNRTLTKYNITRERITQTFTKAWDLISIESLMHPIETFRALYQTFAQPASDLFNFLVEVATQILKLIKDALLRRLSNYAKRLPGYRLITVILGRDIFTLESVPRTVENIILGFMTLIPGGEEKFNQLKESGAIARFSAWLDGALGRLNMTWDYIVGLFTSLWNSFSLSDLAHPIDAFQRIINKFGEPIGRLVNFLFEVFKKLVEILLQIMNFPVDLIQSIVANAMRAYEDIKRDPIGFFKNLLRAVKQGFTQFFGNIGTHLLNGLKGWLFGELQQSGVTPPQDLTLKSILAFVMQVLGITAELIWQKLGQKIGADKVAKIRGMLGKLEGAWSFVQDVMTRGPAAIWDKVKEKLSNLWDLVLDKVKSWIMTKIINAVVGKLLSMLDPTGIMAVVNSFIAFYRAVQSFIERLREILQVVNSFVAGVAEIARGDVGRAANFLEGALAKALPIAIGFLANQVGLRGLGQKIGEMVAALREKVSEGIDWMIDKAIQLGGKLLDMARSAVGGDGTPEERLEKGVKDGLAIVNRFAGKRVGALVLRPLLSAIKFKYGMQSLDVVSNGTKWAVKGVVNPEKQQDSDALKGDDAEDPSSVQGPDLVKVGDIIVDKKNEEAYRVREIKYQVGTLGLALKVENSDVLYLYSQFGTRWEVSSGKPPFVAFSVSGGPTDNRTAKIVIDNEHLGTGTSANIPESVRNEVDYDPKGKWKAAGHLVANSLGGPGGYYSGNIVPMTHNANYTKAGMRGIEDPVYKDIQKNPLSVYDYSVSVVYNPSVQKPPVTITVNVNRLYPTKTLPSTIASPYVVDNT